jgi:hypothetical protein
MNIKNHRAFTKIVYIHSSQPVAHTRLSLLAQNVLFRLSSNDSNLQNDFEPRAAINQCSPQQISRISQAPSNIPKHQIHTSIDPDLEIALHIVVLAGHRNVEAFNCSQ